MNLKTIISAGLLLSTIAAVISPATAADMDKTGANGNGAGNGNSQPYSTSACSAGGPVATWTVRPDEDLQAVLQAWTKKAGWHLQWQSDYNFTIGGSATFHSRFNVAVGSLMSGMQESRPSPVAEVYPENCVLIVTDGLSAVR